LLTSETTRKF